MIWLRHCVTLPVGGWESFPCHWEWVLWFVWDTILYYLLMVGKVLHGFESEFYDLVETLCYITCWWLGKFTMALRGSSMIWLRHCVLHYLLMVGKVFHVNESEFYDLFETLSVTLPVDGWESSPYLWEWVLWFVWDTVLYFLLMVAKILHIFERGFYDLVETLCCITCWWLGKISMSMRRKCYDLVETLCYITCWWLGKFSMSLRGSSMIWLRHCVTLPVDGWESSPWLWEWVL